MKRTKAFLTLIFLTMTAVGCGKNSGFQADEIPTEIARPDDLEGKPFDEGSNDDDEDSLLETELEESQPIDPDLDEPQSQNPNNFLPTDPLPSKPTPPPAADEAKPSKPKGSESEQKPVNPKPAPSKNNLWNAVIDMAKWVIQYEAYKVGKACNFFIQRVLENMGFGKSSWMANDFDNYVKKNFTTYKLKSFSHGTVSANQENLREYIWSFPEKTGFIFQWERKGRHGHIAFVQRIRNELVIYHASLNKFRPKAQRVTVETLLNKSGRNNTLNVFSHFEKSK